jgi:hypothetical protein
MTGLNEDGVIKYDRAYFIPGPALAAEEYEPLEESRKRLHALRLIGVYPSGVGFGNLSLRRDYSGFCLSPRPQFLITGSQTGHLSSLTGAHYCRVLDFDIAGLRVLSMGPVEASSETLTHAAIYLANGQVNAVAHVHHPALWRELQERGFPATASTVAYGTAELAWAVADLARGKRDGLIVMKGHADGFICFASSLARVVMLLEEQASGLPGVRR